MAFNLRWMLVVLVGTCVISVVLLSVGVFTDACNVLSVPIYGGKLHLEVGLWSVNTCLEAPAMGLQIICSKTSWDSITTMMKLTSTSVDDLPNVTHYLHLHLLEVQVLAILGWIAGVLGLLMVCTILKVAKRPVGIAALILLGISVLLVIAALIVKVIYNDKSNTAIAQIYEKKDKTVTLDTSFPWSVLLVGLGAFCNLVAVGILTQNICTRPNEPEEVITSTNENL
ncbi:hypothetical protein DPMN_120773 [Dreissena polymorpha]|uniref:Uncharacterized protein n=1 Tax=Dreissena polymorpha TaxID=45954 RepID=A0A9D4GNY6_DREPO|nr:hypothetical protein DPMN_120773 [Dreissena polymorpha]